MKILYWNVYVGHDTSEVRRELLGMVRQHNPEFVGLGEASRLYGMTLPGYRKYQRKPDPNQPGDNVAERSYNGDDADTAVFVRNDIELDYVGWMRMKLRWAGPKHGWLHKPKIYFIARLKYRGKRRRVSIGHWPFGAAQDETKVRIRKWFLRGKAGVQSIHVGDLNTRADELTAFVKTFGGHQVGHGVDRALYKNCSIVNCKPLGKHGSDHEAILVTVY